MVFFTFLFSFCQWCGIRVFLREPHHHWCPLAKRCDGGLPLRCCVCGTCSHQSAVGAGYRGRTCRVVLDKASETADRLKVIRFRKRPFVQLGEPSFVPGDEEKERGKSSFPSGHTNLGWTTALVMAEVVPECQNEILRRGYEYGYNRLIVGYHWFTDIEATRLLSSALVARLHADPEFRKLVEQAKTEYKQIVTGVTTPVETRQSHVSGIYTLDGKSLSQAPDHGVWIENGMKVAGK